MNFGVLPLRAISFQLLFLMVAISLEAIVFYWRLNFNYPTSVRFATILNLLSTVVGWLLFFAVQVILPEDLRIQLISYFFFERFFPNPWFAAVSPILVVLGLGIFFGVFLVEWGGLELLEWMLGKTKTAAAATEVETLRGFRKLPNRGIALRPNNQAYAVLLANGLSFSAILFLMFVRWIEQSPRL
jgi:hypothetical protein